ncbi:uncharacterized protein [Aristolochia californica]|uniref:uncharacterized protein n=1 Tax=Aristolochia californica TaxID=171875 RepID=UPI0035DD9605
MAGNYRELNSPTMKPDLHRVSVFTPIFCFRYSTREIGKKCDETALCAHRRPEADVSEEIADPVSPRVGCMGQIKKEKVGLPENAKGNRFRKLKKMLSSKSFRREESGKLDRNYSTVVRIIRFDHQHGPPPRPPAPHLEVLDPPLPVTKHSAKNGDGVNLWKRRCGAQLEGLKLQQQRVICKTNSVSNATSV